MPSGFGGTGTGGPGGGPGEASLTHLHQYIVVMSHAFPVALTHLYPLEQGVLTESSQQTSGSLVNDGAPKDDGHSSE